MANFSENKDHSQDWEWGREAYWMAFTGAYPNFPNGSWPTWDATIELDGRFICKWFYGGRNSARHDRSSSESEGSQSSESDQEDVEAAEYHARENIWQRFRMHVWSRCWIVI